MRGHKWSIQMSSATGLTVKQLLQSLGLQKTAALKTLANFLERIAQLYEQGADVRRIGQYVRCWWRWVRAGVEISFVNLCIVRHMFTFRCEL